MADYRLSNEAKKDLIRIHQHGTERFGIKQADAYFIAFFECFDRISVNPFACESVEHIREGYRRCVCGVDTIYYKINGGSVDIMAIVGRQDLSTIFDP